METIIIGGDARFGWLARLLKGEGMRVGTLYRDSVPGVPALEASALPGAKLVVANCPPSPRGELNTIEAIAERLAPDARLALCGPKRCGVSDGRIVDLWADEKLLCDNAMLTAEGAICAAMHASARALRGSRCMVVGWGRLGRALTELLVGLGAKVVVASRSEAKHHRAAERGAETVATEDLSEALPGCDVVFNTAPEMVLNEAALMRADADAMLVDLASAPYGIDLRAAWRLGLRAWREPGLPGRYCPRSAAVALEDALRRNGLIGGGRHE